MHANWFGGLANYDYVSIAKKFNSEKKSVGALTVIRMAIDNIPNTLQLIGPDGSVDYDRVTEFSTADYGFLFSYARAMNESGSLSLGGSAKVIHRTIGEFGSAWGFGADLGLKLKKGNFNFAVSARDITTTFNTWSFNLSEEDKIVFDKTGNEIPVSSTEISLPRFIIGTAYQNNVKNFSYLFELDLNLSTNGREAELIGGKSFSLDPTFGIELGYLNKVFLRGGLGNIQKVLNSVNASNATFEVQPNIGLGLILGRLKVDYALANVGSVSGVLSSHIFSLTLNFAERSKTAEGIN
jgi:hypothetical protein